MSRKKNIVELTRCSVEQYRKMEKKPVKLLADNVRSMHNVGSLFRTADAFLVDEIVLGGISGTPPHPEISKTALGAEEAVKWRHVADAAEEVARLRNQGWKIVVLEQAHGSFLPEECERKPEEKVVLVVGNEVFGVDQKIVDLADLIMEIPQQGTKHSLNVSVSAGIALYALTHSHLCSTK